MTTAREIIAKVIMDEVISTGAWDDGWSMALNYADRYIAALHAAAFGGTGEDWVIRHHTFLRVIARKALEAK
jgi:hypothetical protein